MSFSARTCDAIIIFTQYSVRRQKTWLWSGIFLVARRLTDLVYWQIFDWIQQAVFALLVCVANRLFPGIGGFWFNLWPVQVCLKDQLTIYCHPLHKLVMWIDLVIFEQYCMNYTKFEEKYHESIMKTQISSWKIMKLKIHHFVQNNIIGWPVCSKTWIGRTQICCESQMRQISIECNGKANCNI